MMNPNIHLIEAQKPTVTMYCTINNHLVYEEEQPYGIDKYPFTPFICYHSPEVQNYAFRYRGVVRDCRDSQVELNRRRNRMLDVLDAQIQSGLILKEDALVNPEDAYFQGPGRNLFVKQSANPATDIIPIQPPQIPPSIFELSQLLDGEIMNIAGVNEELFGESSNGKDMSGFLSSLRMGAALVSLQGVFDKLNVSQKLVGELHLDMIQANFEPAKIAKITKKPLTKEFYDKDFQKYHCVVEEGQLTATQRQIQFQQALQLREMGLPIPTAYLLEKSTLQGKKELMEMINAQEQQQGQMQQQAAMQELQQQQVMTQSIQAKTMSDLAAAEEKRAKAVSDLGLAKHHTAMAEADAARASLDNVKAIKEMEQMDEGRLIALSQHILDMHVAQHEIQQNDLKESEKEAKKLTKDLS